MVVVLLVVALVVVALLAVVVADVVLALVVLVLVALVLVAVVVVVAEVVLVALAWPASGAALVEPEELDEPELVLPSSLDAEPKPVPSAAGPHATVVRSATTQSRLLMFHPLHCQSSALQVHYANGRPGRGVGVYATWGSLP